VIRFTWGYRATEAEKKKYPKLWLRDADGDDTEPGKDFWGGGAFQNGTNNLPALWWDQGFTRRVLGVVDLQGVNPLKERQLQDAPPRHYMLNAAWRLANMVDLIRSRWPDDCVSIIAHSQGNMITLAAVAMMKSRGPDALILCNAPYSLGTKFTDSLQAPGGAGGVQSVAARINTLKNLFAKVGKNAGQDKPPERWREHGLTPCGWTPHATERQNAGKVFVYFNPHDRVIGSTPVQGIGWQGIPDKCKDDAGRPISALAQMPNVYQRVVAAGVTVGGPPARYTFVQRAEDRRGFWKPKPETVLGVPILATPDVGHSVMVNAPAVPEAVTIPETFDRDRDEHPLGHPSNRREFTQTMKHYELERKVVRTHPKTGAPIYESESYDEAHAKMSTYVSVATDHGRILENPDVVTNVIAYDLPIGKCASYFDPRGLWKELKKLANWKLSDPYYPTGELLGEVESMFRNKQMPPSIDQESEQQVHEKTMKEREREF
jgi:hypothetical protein